MRSSQTLPNIRIQRTIGISMHTEEVQHPRSSSLLVSLECWNVRLHDLTPFLVAILDAGRNALSFFLLLVVSLGLSVVRENLGKTMIKCQVLAVAHFLFGGVYSCASSYRRHELTHFAQCCTLLASSSSSLSRLPHSSYCFLWSRWLSPSADSCFGFCTHSTVCNTSRFGPLL